MLCIVWRSGNFCFNFENMLKPNIFDLREGNIVQTRRGDIYHVYISDILDDLAIHNVHAVMLTNEILNKNLGFEWHDMGDFWQFERNGFVLIKAKMPMAPGVDMPFTFGFKTTISKTRRFTQVHKLQNFYYEIQEEELEWK
jgi:hypothetical protein